jgi:hypothetical protein
MSVRKDYNLMEDRTSTINKIENMYGLFTQLGIFSDEGIDTRTFQYDQYEDGFGLIEDRAWGASRNQFAGKEVLQTYSFPIPHFPFDGKVAPSAVQSRRAPGTDNSFDTVELAVARELTRIRNSWSQTREWAFRTAIVDGAVYSPTGTVNVNYFTALNVTQKEVYYALDTATTEVAEKGEEVLSHIQDNLMDGTLVTDFVAVCSPSFFRKLIKHQTVKDAYKYYSGNNANGDMLRNRLGTMGQFRTFRGQDDIMYIEYRAAIKGQSMIPDGEARAFPLDTSGNTFKTIYSPPDHEDYVNTPGQEMYAWEYRLERGRGREIETESNFASFIFKPQVIVKLYEGAAP